jgi:hypothetical protein
MGACGNGSTSTSPTAASTTATFNGTLTPQGVVSYPVTVAAPGDFFLTLVSLTPQTTITVGLGVGQPVNGVCQLLTSVENANVGYVMSLSLNPGSYCVVIYDIGNVAGSDIFTLTAAHT